MINKTLLHYNILEKLGEGGMGIVYKAEDTKLKRMVAIKFLPRQIGASDEERERFKIEAQAAAALNHPNIATIYAIEEADGEVFIVMEYIKGKELKELTTEAGELSIEKVTNYATQIAKGLKAAHKKGVTHRDIKSSNIMITDEEQVKIMDFGLAKVKGGAQVTKVGTTLGTAAYMSPEQALSEEVDHRSDIWSFGVVFYEMLTGKLPFGGYYEQAITYAILNLEPEPVSALRSETPVALQQVVEKALAKNRDVRYQHVDEMLVDLKSINGGSSTAAESRSFQKKTRIAPLMTGLFLLFALVVVSGFFYWLRMQSDTTDGSSIVVQRLAVLPFTNIHNEPQTDFLGFALADQIIGSLSYLQNILVRPSSAIRQYQNQIVDAQTAGKALKVDIILTGNYLIEANMVRLNVELVHVDTNEMVWREPIEVEYENTFALQDIVSEKIIDGLKLQFSQDERERMQSDVSQNPLAYEYYLRSISYPSTTEGDLLALKMLNNSIQLDSSYAPAFSELGFRRQHYWNYGLAGTEEIKKAERAYLRALSLNDELLSGLWNLSTLYIETARAEEAVELTKKMLAINPNNAMAHFSLGDGFKAAREEALRNDAEAAREEALKNDAEAVREEALGNDAEKVRRRMLQVKRNVPGNPERKSDNPKYQRAVQMELSADRQFQAQDFGAARDSFWQARGLYRQATDEIMDLIKSSADVTKQLMLEAKSKIDVRYHGKIQYQDAAKIEKEANNAYNNNNFAKATERYKFARERYITVSSEAEEKISREREQEETAQRKIQSLINKYQEIFEDSDIQALKVLLNLTGKELSKWSGFFKIAHDIKVNIESENLQINRNIANVDLFITIGYLDNKNRNQEQDLKYTWTFQRISGEWIVSKIVTLE